LLGVDGGSIRIVDILSFKLTEKTIQQDAVIAQYVVLVYYVSSFPKTVQIAFIG